MLLERFFSELKADFSLIPNQNINLIIFKEIIKINWEVDIRNINVVILMVLLNKVLKLDRLFNKLLKVYNKEKRFFEILLLIIQIGFKLLYFPWYFYKVIIVILRKLNKMLED